MAPTSLVSKRQPPYDPAGDSTVPTLPQLDVGRTKSSKDTPIKVGGAATARLAADSYQAEPVTPSRYQRNIQTERLTPLSTAKSTAGSTAPSFDSQKRVGGGYAYQAISDEQFEQYLKMKQERKLRPMKRKAARVIQRNWRGHHARTVTVPARREHVRRSRASLDIQRTWRGYQGRQQASERRQELADAEEQVRRESAAIQVQRTYRGHQGRLRAAARRAELEAAEEIDATSEYSYEEEEEYSYEEEEEEEEEESEYESVYETESEEEQEEDEGEAVAVASSPGAAGATREDEAPSGEESEYESDQDEESAYETESDSEYYSEEDEDDDDDDDDDNDDDDDDDDDDEGGDTHDDEALQAAAATTIQWFWRLHQGKRKAAHLRNKMDEANKERFDRILGQIRASMKGYRIKAGLSDELVYTSMDDLLLATFGGYCDELACILVHNWNKMLGDFEVFDRHMVSSKTAALIGVTKKGSKNVISDYKHFISLLKRVAQEKYPDHQADEALANLVETFFVPKIITTGEDSIGQDSSEFVTLSSPQVKKVLDRYDGTLRQVYRTYALSSVADDNPEMNSDEFGVFLRELGITPKYLSYGKLKDVFRASNFTQASNLSLDHLDYKEFKLCLVMVAIQLHLHQHPSKPAPPASGQSGHGGKDSPRKARIKKGNHGNTDSHENSYVLGLNIKPTAAMVENLMKVMRLTPSMHFDRKHHRL